VEHLGMDLNAATESAVPTSY